MSYIATDRSVQDGEPIYKFHFAIGSSNFRFTSVAFEVSDSNGTYTPVAIRASEVNQTSDLAKGTLSVTLPRTNSLAAEFLGKVPEQTTSLTIYRGFSETDNVNDQVWWKGRVISATADGDLVKLDCENVFTSMRRPGLRARFQKGCRHALYSEACGVDQSSFQDSVSITGVTDLTVTISGGSSADGYYAGGVIEVGGAKRYVLKHQGSVLTLFYPFNDLSVPTSATVSPGCAHNVEACRDKFNNLLNYGGFPYIPSKNPFRNSVKGSIL